MPHQSVPLVPVPPSRRAEDSPLRFALPLTGQVGAAGPEPGTRHQCPAVRRPESALHHCLRCGFALAPVSVPTLPPEHNRHFLAPREKQPTGGRVVRQFLCLTVPVALPEPAQTDCAKTRTAEYFHSAQPTLAH